MKIISLAPNITEVVKTLNREKDIVACTENCDTKVAEEVGEWLSPKYARIKEIDPDIIFTSDDLQDDIRDKLISMNMNVCHTKPRDISDVIELTETVGDQINEQERAEKVTRRLLERIHTVKEQSLDSEKTVYCEEWDSPPMAAGNWVPKMIKFSGGKYPFVSVGERSKAVKYSEFRSEDPDIFISHICGQGRRSNFRSYREKWDYDGELYFFDDSYINQLSPRTIDGLEALAEVISGCNFGQNKLYTKVNYEDAF